MRKYPREFYVTMPVSPGSKSDGEVVDLLLVGETSKANFIGGVSFGKWSAPDADYTRVHGLIRSALLFYRRAGCPAVVCAATDWSPRNET
jgi:hypothetical protein